MDDLTPETLAEWRVQADCAIENNVPAVEAHRRILALLDALAEARRIRVEVTRTLADFDSAKVWRDDVLIFDGVARGALAAEKAAREEAEREKADLLSPERDTTGLTYGDRRAWDDLCQRWKEAEACADKAEQERDEALAALKAESEIRGDGLAADLAAAVRRADAAEAASAALVARINALADEWEAEAKRACGDTSHYGYSACPDCGSAGYAEAIRALTEKEQDHG